MEQILLVAVCMLGAFKSSLYDSIDLIIVSFFAFLILISFPFFRAF